MNSFKLGLCSVTFRKKTIEEVTEIAKRAGVQYIEWGSDVHVKNIDDAKKAKKLCDKAGIKISSYGSYFNSSEFDENAWINICRIAKILSASSVRIWLGKKNSEKTDAEEYNRLIKNTKRMCDIASEFALTVCPECHDNTFNNDTDAILKFISDLQRNNFRTYFQSRYFKKEYDLDRIERTYPYIENIHISYRDLIKEQFFRNRDKNYITFLLKRLNEKDFNGIIMVEFVCFNSEKEFYKDIEKLRLF